jgi:hypothetical protein
VCASRERKLVTHRNTTVCCIRVQGELERVILERDSASGFDKMKAMDAGTRNLEQKLAEAEARAAVADSAAGTSSRSSAIEQLFW